MSILEVNRLCKKYLSFLLDNASFRLEQGKITGFIGRNGAGKTTTLKSILGFVRPDSGNVSFFGIPFHGNELEIKQNIGYAAGGVSFYPAKKIKTITSVTKQFYSDWSDIDYKDYIELFKIDENKTPSQLSDGMKVKYSLALALSHKAKLLIFDEPTSGLDPVSRDELLDIFLELKDKGITILFSTHITSDLEKCADNIIYIKNGKILAESELNSFTSNYLSVILTPEQKSNISTDILIGCKRGKAAFTALIRADDAEKVEGIIRPASLEDIMIHMEKEDL